MLQSIIYFCYFVSGAITCVAAILWLTSKQRKAALGKEFCLCINCEKMIPKDDRNHWEECESHPARQKIELYKGLLAAEQEDCRLQRENKNAEWERAEAAEKQVSEMTDLLKDIEANQNERMVAPSCSICNDTGEVPFPFGHEGDMANCIGCNAYLLKDWKEAVGKAALAAHTGAVLVPAKVILEIDRLLNRTA